MLVLGALLVTAMSCVPGFPLLSGLPIETSFAFTNFSMHDYAALGIRDHADPEGPFVLTPLLPPGATHRQPFLDALNASCPDALDLRVLIYRRVRHDLPIGLDEGEAVEPEPIVAGEILGVLACGVQVLETYTIVNWEAPEGTARVKIAQNTRIDDAIRASGLFPNVDAAWEVSGVLPGLAETPSPSPAAKLPIAGRVTLADGTGVEGVGVLLRTRFRVRLDDDNPDNDPDAGYGPPIDVTDTGPDGRFAFERPAGAYQVECFSDDYLFRPAVVTLETPSDVVRVIAEPAP